MPRHRSSRGPPGERTPSASAKGGLRSQASRPRSVCFARVDRTLVATIRPCRHTAGRARSRPWDQTLKRTLSCPARYRRRPHGPPCRRTSESVRGATASGRSASGMTHIPSRLVRACKYLVPPRPSALAVEAGARTAGHRFPRLQEPAGPDHCDHLVVQILSR